MTDNSARVTITPPLYDSENLVDEASTGPYGVTPIELRLVHDETFLRVTYKGKIFPEALMSAWDKAVIQYNGIVGMDCLVDIADADVSLISTSQMMELSHLAEYWLGTKDVKSVRIAILVYKPEQEEKALLYRNVIATDLQQVQIFTAEADAIRWLR